MSSFTNGTPVSDTNRLPVDIGSATLSVTADGVEIKNDVGNPIPVNGTVTANAGTDLNTSALALESGGNLASINTKLPSDLTVAGTRLLVDSSGVTQPTSVPARTPTTTSVSSSATSVTILASNANRRGFSISNVSTAKLYLSFTSPATTANAWIEVPPGAFLLLDQQLIVTNAIYGIWASANGTAQVTEYV